jgi:hypothetical protein
MKRRVIVALCASLILAACGGKQQYPGTPTSICEGCPPESIDVSMAVAERDANEIAEYPLLPAISSPTATIAAQGAESFAQGVTVSTLYVGEYPSSVAVFDYPYTKADATITAGISDPAALGASTIDGSQALFVANRGANDITIYEASAYGSPAVTIPGLDAPDGLAFDSQGNLWVAQASNVVEFTPPFTPKSTPTVTIANGLKSPSGIAFDQNGSMYVADSGKNAILVYPAGSTTPSVSVSNGVSGPTDAVVYSNGLFVTNATSNTVAEFDLPLTDTSAPIATDSTGTNAPSAVAFLGFLQSP